MVKRWIVTGDTHGDVKTRLKNIFHNNNIKTPSELGVIILGDAGLNFYLNKTDIKKKKELAEFQCYIYCVRGNHEERPQNLGYAIIYDNNVQGYVYLDPINENIRYFKDGEFYNIDNHRILVIGGAYSVDKWYRLKRAEMTGNSCSGWFASEQLTETEKNDIAQKIKGEKIDFVFTHTCPISWEPNDLFLNMIDQSQVDKTTEIWLEDIKNNIDWNIWCFGHYHADRLERPRVEQFYTSYCWLDEIWNRWNNNGDIAYMTKAPLYYAD